MSRRRSAQMPKESGARTPSAVHTERARQLVGEGAHLLSERRVTEAVGLLTEAWGLDPGNASAAINLGGAYILLGKHGKAVPVLEAAVRLEPNNAMVWVNLAAAHLGKLPFATVEQQDKAIVAFERALALNPITPHVHYNLGLIYLERNDSAQAAAHFRAALDVDPFDADARHWLEQIGQAAAADGAA